MPDMMKPDAALLVKLGSIVVHFDEYTGVRGHAYDLHTARQLLDDPDVKVWIAEMTKAAMLPQKRS